MKSKLCLSCAHTNVCCKDKNLVGDIFVAGDPRFFDNKDLFRKYEEKKAAGFPCDDYMAIGKPATNASRIRAMTDEELAEWLGDVSKSWYDEGYTKAFDETLVSGYPSTATEWIKWLEATNG